MAAAGAIEMRRRDLAACLHVSMAVAALAACDVEGNSPRTGGDAGAGAPSVQDATLPRSAGGTDDAALDGGAVADRGTEPPEAMATDAWDAGALRAVADGPTDAGLGPDDATDAVLADRASPSDAAVDTSIDRDAGLEEDGARGVDSDGADAGGDASEDMTADGGDASTVNATAALLVSARNAACAACAAQNQCLGSGQTCDDLAGQVAAAGPDAGESRMQLCLDALSCMLSTFCYESGTGLDVCICGPETQAACTSSGPLPEASIQCVLQEQAGLETTDPTTELQNETDAGLGAGVANALILCLTNALCTDCF